MFEKTGSGEAGRMRRADLVQDKMETRIETRSETRSGVI